MSQEILIQSILKRVKKKGFTDWEVKDLLKDNKLMKEGVQWISIDSFEIELRKALRKQELTNHSQETKHHFSLVEPDERVQMGEKSSLSHMNKTPDASNGSDKNICNDCNSSTAGVCPKHPVKYSTKKFTPKGDKR